MRFSPSQAKRSNLAKLDDFLSLSIEMIPDSYELLLRLRSMGMDNASRDPWWWPESGSFEALVGAILTQNSRWERVEISLENLRQADLLKVERVAFCSETFLREKIRPSGFYNAKTRNLQELSRKILEDFDSFGYFRERVDRTWLLACRGVGPETADAILNYVCYKEAFVVDSYTGRLLEALGYALESYEALQEWMLEGIEGRCGELFPDLSTAQCFARAHGMVVEYCKQHRRGRKIDVSMLL